MKLLRRHPLSELQDADCVLTVGAFDGLHRGHRVLIDRALALGRQHRLPVVLLSFEPLPREFLNAADPPPRLTNFRERWRLLQGFGLDGLCLLPFNEKLRQMSGAQFVQQLRRLGARHVVVGHDFRFGRGGQADAAWCAEQGRALGFAVDVVEPVQLVGQRIGSRLVRDALAAGELTRAADLLGRPYSMRGRVLRGRQLGRQLGFPTANIAMHRRRLPLSGIFAVRVHARGHAPPLQGRPGVASLGTRPTVNGGQPLLETFLFDFDSDLYGCEIEVEFVARLRDEQKFESIELMVEQMHRDAAQARAFLE